MAPLLAGMLCGPALLHAQNPTSASQDLARGQKVFAENCAGCHGSDALGTDRSYLSQLKGVKPEALNTYPRANGGAIDFERIKPLWRFATNGENKASPMTYVVGGKQFVAIAIGPNILCFGLATGSEAK